MTIQIPQQFKNEKFRFVKLLPKTKKPYEKEWQKKGYKYDDEGLNQHLEVGNYGVLLGHGNLICIDVDNRELISYFDKECKDTLIIETGSGKRHVYYFCDVRKNKNIDGLGELRCSGVQTVGPGSIHPDTDKEYKILNDKPIKEISKEELDKIININFKGKSFIVGENLDKSRSGEEFWECVHKIEDDKTKEEIFRHMENKRFEKWNTHGKSYPSYREKTYTAALNFVNKNKEQVMQENEDEIKDLGFWTIRDYEEYKPTKDYIIDQIMYPNDIEMIYGQSGHMKSLDILYRAVCIVSGRKYLGKFKVKKCPVAIISAENHKKVDKHRLKAIMRGLKIRKKDLSLYILPRENCGDLLESDFKKGVEKFVKKKGIKVLIIDTINPVTPEVDDNKARDVTRVFNEFFKPFVDKYKINICFLHHTDKQAKSFLGSTKFKANSDVTSLIVRKTSNSYRVVNEKNREGEVNGLEIGVEFIKDKNETKEIKFELIKEIEEKGIFKVKKKTKSNKIENKIMSLVTSTPKARAKLIGECSEVGSKATIDRVLKKLVKDKKLNNSDEGYFLGE